MAWADVVVTAISSLGLFGSFFFFFLVPVQKRSAGVTLSQRVTVVTDRAVAHGAVVTRHALSVHSAHGRRSSR